MRSKGLEFEQHNFRIDSTNWEKIRVSGKECLGNPEGDVLEIVGGDYKGEQLFTCAAAIRETIKAGKRMPTNKEFSKIFKTGADMPNLVLVGYCGTPRSFDGQGKGANFWSLTEGGYVWYREDGGPGRITFNTAGQSSYFKNVCSFSVRCLQ